MVVVFLTDNNTTPTKVVLSCFGLLVGLWQLLLNLIPCSLCLHAWGPRHSSHHWHEQEIFNTCFNRTCQDRGDLFENQWTISCWQFSQFCESVIIRGPHWLLQLTTLLLIHFIFRLTWFKFNDCRKYWENLARKWLWGDRIQRYFLVYLCSFIFYQFKSFFNVLLIYGPFFRQLD